VIEDHAKEQLAQMIHILLNKEVVNNAQIIQDPLKLQAVLLVKVFNAQTVSILMLMVNAHLAQLSKLLILLEVDVLNHNVMRDKLYSKMVHYKTAQLIQEQLELTLLNNVEHVDLMFAMQINILVLMVNATTVIHILFQIQEIKIEIDA
jgi:hypothetical protein